MRRPWRLAAPEIATAATILVALLAGCATGEQPGTTVAPEPSVQVAQLCDSVRDFFTGDLGAVDVRTAPVLSPDATVTRWGECALVNVGDGLRVGNYQLRHSPDDPDPTGNYKGYEKTVRDGRELWIWDWRRNPWFGSGQVLLAARVGQWNATLEIVVPQTHTASGELMMTDDNLRKAIDFLFRYTDTLISELPGDPASPAPPR
ncbi:hypothetical protein [Nocardia jiangsuensis]|uniref:Polyketide cyclase/dehydrase/lipid transport protein n=1 Tax=Nocardia jiangsuensis TaxID=1691563 RepID=A0ABV8E2K5_9NOCA